LGLVLGSLRRRRNLAGGNPPHGTKKDGCREDDARPRPEWRAWEEGGVSLMGIRSHRSVRSHGVRGEGAMIRLTWR